jgi:hypothetical protein
MDTLDVYKTDGDWRLVRRFPETQMRHTYLEHNCGYVDNRIPLGLAAQRWWRATNFTVDTRDRACPYCHTRASDGLQAIFWIMKEEPI